MDQPRNFSIALTTFGDVVYRECASYKVKSQGHEINTLPFLCVIGADNERTIAHRKSNLVWAYNFPVAQVICNAI